MPVKNLIGNRFGYLIVLCRGGHIYNKVAWQCRCDCGEKKQVSGNDLSTGNTRSCGCLQRELKVDNAKELFTTHGKSMSPEYRSWSSAKGRCTNPNNVSYGAYGGRGISMCKRWSDSFEAFLEDMGCRPKGSTIDRIDSDGNYEPSNCRWATILEQSYNRRRGETGYLGVYQNGKGFMAKITRDGKSKYLGSYPTIEQAIEARATAEHQFK